MSDEYLERMRGDRRTSLLGTIGAATILAVAAGVALEGCGSGTKTVTAASSPPTTQSTGTTGESTQTVPTTTTPAHTAPGQTTTNGGTPGPGTTRTAPEPAFTKSTAGQTGEGVSGAEAVLREKGYTAKDSSDYHGDQTLRVLVGTRSGSGDGYGQQAFFFVDGRFLGTDSREPSATLRVASQSDTEVTLEYPLYKHSDPLCCPGGGRAKVRFQLNNGKLTPLDAIPPASSNSGLSRN